MVRKRSTKRSESVLDGSPHLNVIHESTANPKRANMNSSDALSNAYKFFTVNRLRVELRRKGLKTSGKKSALVILKEKKYIVKLLRLFCYRCCSFGFFFFFDAFLQI